VCIRTSCHGSCNVSTSPADKVIIWVATGYFFLNAFVLHAPAFLVPSEDQWASRRLTFFTFSFVLCSPYLCGTKKGRRQDARRVSSIVSISQSCWSSLLRFVAWKPFALNVNSSLSTRPGVTPRAQLSRVTVVRTLTDSWLAGVSRVPLVAARSNPRQAADRNTCSIEQQCAEGKWHEAGCRRVCCIQANCREGDCSPVLLESVLEFPESSQVPPAALIISKSVLCLYGLLTFLVKSKQR
jgi:hypothetical protein